jgi:hypothetical protein
MLRALAFAARPRARYTGREGTIALMRGAAAVLVRGLGKPRLRRVVLAFAGFSLAAYAVWTAMLVYAYDRGGTTTAGVIAVVQLVPAVFVAPLGAEIVDSRGGGYGLLLGYVLQAVAMGITAAVILVDGPAIAAYAFAVIAVLATTLSRPAQVKALSSLAEHPDELTGATALCGWIEGFSALAGPALAGLGIALDGPGLVFAAFAVAVAGSAVTVVPFSARRDLRVAGTDERSAGVLAGVQALRSERPARALVVMLTVEQLVIGALDVLAVVLAISTLGLGAPSAGYLNAAFGAGATVGGLAGITLAGRRRVAVPLIGAALAWAVMFTVLGVHQTTVAAFLLLPLAGVCRAVLETAGKALLVRVTPHEVLGRVFGVLEGLMLAGLAAGALLVPILVALGGVRAALIGVAAVLAAAVLAPLKSFRRLDTTAPAAALAIVRAHPLFDGLPPEVLEGLARNLAPNTTHATDHVIVQGDVGDRFYLISAGEFDVSIDGRFITTLGPGQGFGEIALLRDVPRTADVTARTDGLLYSLEREPFLEALRSPMSTNLP